MEAGDVHPCKKFKSSCSICLVSCDVMKMAHIVETVLSCMTAKEVLSAPIFVCREWRNIATKLINGRNASPVRLFLKSESSSEENDEPFLSSLKPFLENCYFLPRKVFVITSKKLLPTPEYIRDNSRRLCYMEVYKAHRHRMMTCFIRRELVPRDCEVYAISSYGVYGLQSSTNQSVNCINENRGAVTLAMSERYSTCISFFSLPECLGEEMLTEETLKMAVGCPLEAPLKFLLYLSAQHGEFPRTLLGKIFSILPNLVVTGALIDQHNLYDSKYNLKISSDCITGLAIYGKNVTSSCLVLSGDIRTEGEIGAAIYRFRNSVGTLTRNSLAVLVFCLARSSENDIACFRTHFPGINAIGLYGYGEFGRNVVAGKCSDFLQDYDHSYSTVISIVNFEDPALQ